jgi:hypothetical protein
MVQNPAFSVIVAAVVRRLVSRFDKLKASGVTTAATTEPKSFGVAHDRAFGVAHSQRQASVYWTHGE